MDVTGLTSTVRKSAVVLSCVTCFTLSGCVHTHNTITPKDYAVSFSVDHGKSFLQVPEGQYQTQFTVHVGAWNSNDDHGKDEVFVIVTNTQAPVLDLETNDDGQHFAYGGWSDVSAENAALAALGLQPIPRSGASHNWVQIVDASGAAAQFVARTEKPVNPRNWRFVILALQGGRTATVLWTKEIEPSSVNPGT